MSLFGSIILLTSFRYPDSTAIISVAEPSPLIMNIFSDGLMIRRSNRHMWNIWQFIAPFFSAFKTRVTRPAREYTDKLANIPDVSCVTYSLSVHIYWYSVQRYRTCTIPKYCRPAASRFWPLQNAQFIAYGCLHTRWIIAFAWSVATPLHPPFFCCVRHRKLMRFKGTRALYYSSMIGRTLLLPKSQSTHIIIWVLGLVETILNWLTFPM